MKHEAAAEKAAKVLYNALAGTATRQITKPVCSEHKPRCNKWGSADILRTADKDSRDAHRAVQHGNQRKQRKRS